MMMNVAIVEDDDAEFESIKSLLERFSGESGHSFGITRFKNAVGLLTGYKSVYDIIFMDIGLPGMNGFEASKRLRALDKDVILIFVTSMSRFAVSGYEVGAFDFVVKPVKYGSLRLKLMRAAEKLSETEDVKIKVPSPEGTRFVAASAIKYVEVMNHSLIFHTTSDDINSYGALKNVEAMLPKGKFAKCNSCYLVNLKFVTAVKEYIAVVAGEELKVSHAKKKEFLQAIGAYMEGLA